jgi:hypothetical protein
LGEERSKEEGEEKWEQEEEGYGEKDLTKKFFAPLRG